MNVRKAGIRTDRGGAASAEVKEGLELEVGQVRGRTGKSYREDW